MKLAHPLGVEIEDRVQGQWYPYGVGIDVHKLMLWACVLRPDYRKSKQDRHICKFSCDADGFALLHKWLNGLVPSEHRRFLIESTSTYHFPVLWELSDWVPIVINPKLVGGSKRKTDRWDAQKLAHHCLAGTFPAYVLPTVEELGWRTMFRRYVKIQRAVQRNVSALRSRLTMFGVNSYGPANSDRGWRIFRSLAGGRIPSPCSIRVDAFDHLVGYATHLHRIPQSVLAVNLEQVQEVEELRAQAQRVWESLLESVDGRGLRLLRTVPHIHDHAAVCFLAEVGRRPGRRFSSLPRIVAYAGFDPSKRVSADTVTSYLPTAGSVHLRRVFKQVAQGVLQARGCLGDYGQRVMSAHGKKGWMAGVNAVGRRLIRYCAAVLRYDHPFVEGETHGETERQEAQQRWRRQGGGCPASVEFVSPVREDGGQSAVTLWDRAEAFAFDGGVAEGSVGDDSCGGIGFGWQGGLGSGSGLVECAGEGGA